MRGSRRTSSTQDLLTKRLAARPRFRIETRGHWIRVWWSKKPCVSLSLSLSLYADRYCQCIRHPSKARRFDEPRKRSDPHLKQHRTAPPPGGTQAAGLPGYLPGQLVPGVPPALSAGTQTPDFQTSLDIIGGV